MRIWHYTRLDPQGLGGVEKHIRSVSQRLKQFGHEVHIGASAPPWGEQGDIIHTHGDAWPSSSLLRMARSRARRMRWVHVAHGTSFGRLLACREYFSLSGWRGVARDLAPARLADAIVTVSAQVYGEVQRYFRIHKPMRTIPNGVDDHIFKPVASLTSSPRLVFVGRGADRVKNTALLISACDRIYSSRADLELWGIPSLGTKRPYISEHGPVNASEIAKCLAQCRALALTSLYEGDGIVLREAQAIGIGIVASRIPSLEENVAGYANAFLANPHSTDSMAEAIERCLYLSPLMRPAPRLRSWTAVAKEFEAFYNALNRT